MNAKVDGLIEEKRAKDKQITELTATLREFMSAKVCSCPPGIYFFLQGRVSCLEAVAG